jgi:hypothetical protein
MKMKFFLCMLVGLLAISVVMPNSLIAAGPPNSSKKPAWVGMPPHAVEVAPGIFYLGTAIDKGRVVEGYAIIRPAKGRRAKPGCNYNGICEKGENKNSCVDCAGGGVDPDTSKCYGHFARGAKWKTTEDYVANGDNDWGLDPFFMLDTLDLSIGKWEFAGDVPDTFGNGELTTDVLVADHYETDGLNEIYFDSLHPGTIAYTVVWGIFRGPVSQRELVEWDQVYNNDLPWSDCMPDCPGAYDFESIATHEMGHSFGTDDLYSKKCSDQTMYGYGYLGDISPRTLEDGDMNGIWILYNE